MLKQRVITAVLLLLVLLGSLLVSATWPFAALSLLFIAAAAWEWGRLNHASVFIQWGTVLAVMLVGTYLAATWGIPMWSQHLHGVNVATPTMGVGEQHVHGFNEPLAGFAVPVQLWWALALTWIFGSAWMLRRGLDRWASVNRQARVGLGGLLLLGAWLAIMEAKHQGLNLMFSIMALVWVADIGAYFAGRAFGRRKLALSISPGKSWEGAVAGAVATQLMAWSWVMLDQNVAVDSPSLYSHLLHGVGGFGMTLLVAGLAIMSVVGDLVESLVKRVAQVKDSSQLLPGHGGVLDRLDALLPVLPVSMALLSLCHG